jgi:uncharacterized Zn finger protein (UPF0148 family)
MSTNVVMRLDCPHCAYSLFEAVSLIRPNGSAYCPACCKSFVLDPEIEAMSRLLAEAKAARRERKRRRKEMQSNWNQPQPTPAPEPQKPQLLGDVLRRLDALLAEMETSARRA